MSIVYRAARPKEVPAAADLFLEALADLVKRKGLSPPSHTRASILPVYEHILASGVFELALEGERAVALCNGVVRGELGFLSMFWTRPGLQRRGIGGPLLERVLGAMRERGAQRLATWSSLDHVAIASYLKAGMLPGGPIFTFSGPIRSERDEPDPAYTLRALDEGVVGAIDLKVRGDARQVDHAFFRARGGVALQLERAGQPRAYFYALGGVIGPAAWLEVEDGPELLRAALRVARSQAREVRLIALGANTAALGAALGAGLHLQGQAHWLCSAPFGRLEQYVPSGPALF